jgi:3D (Asp-Asp-Asp) domain-containing protein
MERQLSQLRAALSSSRSGARFGARFWAVCILGGCFAASAIGLAAARAPEDQAIVTRTVHPQVEESSDARLLDVSDLAMAVQTVPVLEHEGLTNEQAPVEPAQPVEFTFTQPVALTQSVTAAPVVGSSRHRVRVIQMEVTAYCPCVKCCGKGAHGVTASGKPVTFNRGRFAAADTDLLPFETRIQIPGYNGGKPIEVIDRGGAIKGHKLDVFFPTHKQALEWGRRTLQITVLE